MYTYICIYIYGERERETLMGSICEQIIPIMLPLFVADHPSQSPSPGHVLDKVAPSHQNQLPDTVITCPTPF